MLVRPAWLSMLFFVVLPVWAQDSAAVRLAQLERKIALLQTEVKALRHQIQPAKQPQTVSKKANVPQRTNRYQAAVMTSPTMGLISEYDGRDLIVSYSSMKQYLKLLNQRQRFSKDWHDHGLNRPALQLSGGVEGQFQWADDAAGHTTDIDLSRFELDVLAEVNPWIAAMGSMSYDNGSDAAQDRTKSSNLYLKRGFFVLGDLSKSPYYAAFGQMYMPFGRYSSYMLSSGIPVSLGRISGRGLVLGYYGLDQQDNGLSTSVYLMQGKSRPSPANASIDQFGAEASWMHHFQNGSIQLGAGWVRNIADADKVEQALRDKTPAAHRLLQQRVAGLDVYAIAGLQDWRMVAEYVSAMDDIVANSIDYGQYSAMHFELDRNFGTKHWPSNWFLAYDRSIGIKNNLLNQPRVSWATGLAFHMWKNTLQAIEFRHKKPYGTGDDEDSLTMQFGLYF